MSKLTVSAQERLLKRCIRRHLDLSKELAKMDCTYDELRYRYNSRRVETPTAYVKMGEIGFPNNGIPAVSFFSGSGGLDIGFSSAGFDSLAAFEIDRNSCDTLRANHPLLRVFGPPSSSGDLRNREETEAVLRSEVGVKSPFEGIFYGGPPCQSFSIAANQRFAKSGDNFKRVGFSHKDYGTLLFDFIWYLRVFKPRAFLLENVPGLVTIDGGKQLTSAMMILSQELRYQITDPMIVDAQFYGVPQKRERVFVFGWRKNGRFVMPRQDLLRVPCYKAFEKPLSNTTSHVTRRHKAKSVIRYMELGYGERDMLGRADRLDPTLPSKTVIAGGTRGGGRSHLHPDIPRTLSPRECARLQTFPDSYVFHGSLARQFTQIGNAVPPLLALKLARAIYESIFKRSNVAL